MPTTNRRRAGNHPTTRRVLWAIAWTVCAIVLAVLVGVLAATTTTLPS